MTAAETRVVETLTEHPIRSPARTRPLPHRALPTWRTYLALGRAQETPRVTIAMAGKATGEDSMAALALAANDGGASRTDSLLHVPHGPSPAPNHPEPPDPPLHENHTCAR